MTAGKASETANDTAKSTVENTAGNMALDTTDSAAANNTFVAEALQVDRGGRVIVENVGFALAPGAALVVSGPNGAGKSTLLRALAGLLPLARGRIALGAQTQDVFDALHYVGHLDGMKPALTARENLTFWGAYLGARSSALSPHEALAAVGLPHVAEFAVAYLSAGQKRRVALARLLVAWRPVWLLDEPTTALDVAAQARFADLMRVYRAEGGIVVAATHAPLGLDDAETLRLEPARRRAA